MICALSAAVFAGTVSAGPRSDAAPAPLAISIRGSHFVDGAGHPVRLLGVNHTSAEYGCVDGFGYDDGHFDDTDARAIASWGANAVRVPLNEDCWLGINGQPNSDQGADPKLTQAGYQHEIAAYVADLNRHGLYAILDLHWTAPGGQVALEQQPMPDLDHSPAFWTSVAAKFKTNRAVVFDLFNEPYDPTDPRSGDDTNPADKVTWNCWETGTIGGPGEETPCHTSAYDDNNNKTGTYQVAGLQTLLNAVRATGARAPVISGGLDYANDLGVHDHGRQWMTHAPDDPLNQEAAGFHNYMGKSCDSAACWKGTIAPIAAHVPVVTGEFDEDNFTERTCADKTPSTFDESYMNWADSAGVSYLAWGWIVESPAERAADGCSAFYLIDDYSRHTPSKPNGSAVHDHLRALAIRASAPPAITLTAFRVTVRPGNAKVAFTLRSAETCAGSLTGLTTGAYRYGKGKAHRIALGSARVALSARRTATLALALTKAGHALLVSRHALTVRITMTLTSPHHRRTVLHRTVTLTVAKRGG